MTKIGIAVLVSVICLLFATIFQFYIKTPMPKEDWPSQRLTNRMRPTPTHISCPPYSMGILFSLPGKSYFFKTRSSLDKYINYNEKIEDLILNGEAFLFPRKYIVKAEEDIVSYQGRVSDKILGDGYIIMTSRF